MNNDKDDSEKTLNGSQISSFIPGDESSELAKSTSQVEQGVPHAVGQITDGVQAIAKKVGGLQDYRGRAFVDLARIAAAAEPMWMKVARENQSTLDSIMKSSPFNRLAMLEASSTYKIAQALSEPVWMKVAKDSHSNFQAMIDRIQRSTSIFAPILEQANRFQNEFASYIREIEGPLASMGQQFAEFSRHLDKYPDEVREGLLVMGEYGWCLDFEMGMSEPVRFKALVDDGRELDANNEMIEHFELRADSIRQSIVELYPKRAHIIDAAFKAYVDGQYVLAIPIFLAQVDGICLDVVNAHFFMAKGRKKVVEHVMSIAGGSITRAFLAPFEVGMGISLSERDRPDGFSGLNRHMVLHGESVDYGTRENCLKSISLLNYISQSLQRALEKIDEDSPGQRADDSKGEFDS